MGLLGSLFGSDPEYVAPQENAEANAAIEYLRKNSERSPEQIHKATMEGANGGAYLENENDRKSSDSALGMMNDEAARAAIAQRAEKQYGSAYNDISRDHKISSVSRAIESKNVHDQLALRQKAINSAAAHHRAMAELQTEKARNDVLGSVLGAVGWVGGYGAANGWFGGGGSMPAPSSSSGDNFGGLVAKAPGKNPYGL